MSVPAMESNYTDLHGKSQTFMKIPTRDGQILKLYYLRLELLKLKSLLEEKL